jgi:hypothetical protein
MHRTTPPNNTITRLIYFWEDRHPTVRNAITLAGLALGGMLLLSVAMFLTPRLLNVQTALMFMGIEPLWTIVRLVIVGLLFLSFLRSCILVWQQRIGVLGFGIVCVAPVMVLGGFSVMPTFFSTAVGYQMGSPFVTVYAEFRELCDRWDDRYGEVEVISFRPEEISLGIFEHDSVEVWRERYTVFIDVGGEEESFGLACVVGGAEEPFAEGRFSRYFEYRHLQGKYYEFYRERN